LRAEPVLRADETPVNVARRDVHEAGRAAPGGQRVVTLRTPDERLAWYAADRPPVQQGDQGSGGPGRLWRSPARCRPRPSSRPASSRTRSRNASCRRFRLPSARHRRKYQNTACHAGTPWAAAARRNRCARGEDRVDECRGRVPLPTAAAGGGDSGSISRHRWGPSGRRHTGAATRGKTPLQQGRRSATIRLALPPARPLPEERELATKPQRRDRAA
jgi:hypothetical protein